MAEIEVPDFKSIGEFQSWVAGLDPEAIQSWKTEDWLKMYEKVDAYVASDDFARVYKENAAELAGRGVFAQSSADDVFKMADNIAVRKKAFTEWTGDYFGIMYRNYHFEPETLAYITKIAQQDGQKLAAKSFDAAALAISDTDKDITDKLYSIGKITEDGTHYGSTPETGKVYCGALVDRTINGGVAIPIERGKGLVKVNPGVIPDRNISLAFHEFAHIYKQGQNPLQKELADKGFLAHPELGRNFQKLMEKNHEYYLTPERAQAVMNEVDYSLFSASEWRSISRRAYNGYHKQPMERYSNMYGVMAERAFRAASGQTSEQNAMRVADIIGGPRGMPDLPDFINGFIIKRPAKAMYTPEGIKLRYEPPNGYGVGDVEEKIKRRFLGADEKMMQKLKFSKDEIFGYFDVVVPGDYSFSLQLNKFERNSMKVSLPPVGEMATANVSPLSNELHTGTAGASLSSVKESKTLSQARKATATASAKMEEKLVARGGMEVTKQVTAKTVKKKTSVLATAAAANAKFDKAVDKAIEKGAEKINNSKVGKAYGKTVTKIANTKTGKAVATATKTAANKVANTAVGKATGKVVGKVVSKTVGTTVGKSVLKKIPLVSAAAGAYFAYNRIKNGEWGAACCEFVSGVAGCFPGVGTGISLALDGGLATNDIYNAVKQPTGKKEKKEVTPTPNKKAVTTKKPPLAKASEPKKTVTKTSSITPEAMAALRQKQGGRS